MPKQLCTVILLTALGLSTPGEAITEKECAKLVSDAAVDSLAELRLLPALAEFGRNVVRVAIGLPAISSATIVDYLLDLGLAHVDRDDHFIVDADLRNLQIADVGSGRSNFGATMNALETQTGTHVVSIDHAALAGAVPGTDFVRGSVLDLPIESKSRDLTVSRGLISYFLPLTRFGFSERKFARLHKALFELIRITRDGGEVRFTFSPFRNSDLLYDVLGENPRVGSMTMKSGPTESMLMIVRLKER